MRSFFFHPRGHGHHHDRFHGHRDGSGRGFGRQGRFGNPFDGNPFEGRRGAREGRGFGHGGLRLVLLKLISEKPSHGYELIKDIEERFKGNYSPSPGVIYPTLSWLEDEGFITISPGDDGRKQAHITEAGVAFLNDKAAEVDALFTRMSDEATGEHGHYMQLFRAMHNLKSALKMRGMRPFSQSDIEAIVDLIDETAKKIERS